MFVLKDLAWDLRELSTRHALWCSVPLVLSITLAQVQGLWRGQEITARQTSRRKDKRHRNLVQEAGN